MPTPLSPEKKQTLQRNLTAILAETRTASISQNIAEKFLVPFAIVLGARSLSIGILSTLPQLSGAIAQLFSVKILSRLGTRKKVISLFLFLQALMWLPLFLVPFLFPSIGIFSLIGCFSVYYVLGGLYTPAWTSWLASIVPEHARGRFFGTKNQAAGRFGFLAATLGGYLLHLLADVHIWLAYGILFLCGFLAKLVSIIFVLRMKEDEEIQRLPLFQGITFIDFLRHIKENSFGQYVFYMCCMSFATNIAAPYFIPYMLRPVSEGGLGWNYLQFTIISAIASCAAFFVFKHWGSLADRFGNKRVLVFTGFLIPFVPLLWIFSQNYWYLLFVEIFSGIAWAGFNLVTANYVFDLVGSQNRMLYTAYYNSLTTFSIFLGALAGSQLKYVGLFFGINGFLFLFAISFLCRFAVALFFLTKLRELREVEGYHFFHELAIHPVQGFTHGAVQSVRDSFVHFKRKHMLDIVKAEHYIEKKMQRKKGK